MNLEIERKFLVEGDFKPFVAGENRIVQGYLCSTPGRSVRIRISGGRGILTIKGMSNESGMSRFEWERELSLSDAEALMKLCEPGMIEKTRFLVPAGRHIFEIDVFHGENAGLTLAEIELSEETELFEKPPWLGQEVTGRIEYYNSSLMRNPFSRW